MTPDTDTPLTIVQVYPGRIWGGAEQYILDLSRALRSKGHKVVQLCLNAPPVTARLESENEDFTPVSLHDLPEAIEAATPDLVHIHDTRFLGHTANAPVVLTRHIARRSRVLPPPFSRRRKTFRNLRAMIFVSDIARRIWLQANPWMPGDKCHTIHNSIPPTEQGTSANQPAADLRQLYGIPATTPLLMFTGRVRKSKGCADIIQALAQVGTSRPWAMVFIGAGKPVDYPDRLRRMAANHGIADRIHLHPFTTDTRMLVCQADIGLQPSRVREAFGLSQIEFMQAGKALITTDNGAQPEYVDPGVSGLLIPPRRPDLLANAIASLLDNPDRRQTIGLTSARFYEKTLSYPRFLGKIEEIYRASVRQ